MKERTQVLLPVVVKLIKNIDFLELEVITDLIDRLVVRTPEEENQSIPCRDKDFATNINNIALTKHRSFLLSEIPTSV